MFRKLERYIFKERIPEEIAKEIYIPLADALSKFKRTLCHGEWDYEAELEIKRIIDGPKGSLLLPEHCIKTKVTVLNKKEKFLEKREKVSYIIRKTFLEYSTKPSRGEYRWVFEVIFPKLIKGNPLNIGEIRDLCQPRLDDDKLRKFIEKIEKSAEASEFANYIKPAIKSSEVIKNSLMDSYKRDVSYPERRRVYLTIFNILAFIILSGGTIYLANENINLIEKNLDESPKIFAVAEYRQGNLVVDIQNTKGIAKRVTTEWNIKEHEISGGEIQVIKLLAESLDSQEVRFTPNAKNICESLLKVKGINIEDLQGSKYENIPFNFNIVVSCANCDENDVNVDWTGIHGGVVSCSNNEWMIR